MSHEPNLAEALAAQTEQSARTLRALIDVIPAGVVIADASGAIVARNRAADLTLGGIAYGIADRRTRGYTLHRGDGSVFPVHELPIPRAIERGESTREVAIVIRYPDGAERTVLATGCPIRDREGHITGAIAVCQDITEREQTISLLRARERQQAAVGALGREALAGVEFSRLFDDAVKQVAQTLTVEFAKVLELLPDRDDLRLRAGVGWKAGLVSHAIVDGGLGSQAGFTLRSAHPVIVDDLRTETRFVGPALLRDHGVVSGISVIIAGRERPFGVLGAHTRHHRVFTADDVNFIQSVANVLAMAVERTRSDEELRSTEERLRTVVTNAPIVLFALDRDGMFTLSTGKALGVLELKPGEIVGQSVFEVYRNEPSIIKHARQALAGETLNVVDTTKDGLVWETRWTPLRDQPGNVVGVTGVVTDVTQRFRAEQERARLRAREQALAHIAQALVHGRDLTSVVDVVIAESQHILGADIVGVWLANTVKRHITLLAYRGQVGEAQDRLRDLSYDAPSLSALAAKTDRPQVVEDVLTGDRGLPISRYVATVEGMRSALALPLHSGGRLVGVVTYGWRTPRRMSAVELAFNQTIADLFAVAIENANLNDRVRQALAVREEFMAAAAHQLRTPLTLIKGRTQLLLRAAQLDERVRHSLESVDQYTDVITRIVNDLLLSLRVRPGLTSLTVERLDLNTLAEAAVTRAKRATTGYQARLETDGALPVDVDPSLIVEAVVRLVENALRYSRPGGTVEVRTRRQDGEAIVSVTDHGAGIPFERQPHAFEPFYELVPPGEPGYAGVVDLGLYLTKQIVEAHGGRVWLESTPGQGSTFYLALKLAESSP